MTCIELWATRLQLEREQQRERIEKLVQAPKMNLKKFNYKGYKSNSRR